MLVAISSVCGKPGGLQWKVFLADRLQWESGACLTKKKDQMPGFIKEQITNFTIKGNHFLQVSIMECDRDSETGDNFLFVLDLKVTRHTVNNTTGAVEGWEGIYNSFMISMFLLNLKFRKSSGIVRKRICL